LAFDMGLSAGTAGVGKPRGKCHSYTAPSTANGAAKAAEAAAQINSAKTAIRPACRANRGA
jgi:hypothetical protein